MPTKWSFSGKRFQTKYKNTKPDTTHQIKNKKKKQSCNFKHFLTETTNL